MPKSRSPKYPSISITKAIVCVKDLYNEEGTSPVIPNIAVQHWGYKGLNGNSRGLLSSVRQYGLIDYKDKLVKITNLGLSLAVHDNDQPEFISAIKEAVFFPPVLMKIKDDFRESSDKSIISTLQMSNFTPSGAAAVTEIYRRNEAYLNSLTSQSELVGADQSKEEGGEDQLNDQRLSEMTPMIDEKVSAQSPSTKNIQKPLGKGMGTPDITFQLNEEGLSVEVFFTGGQVTKSDIDQFVSILNVLKVSYPENN